MDMIIMRNSLAFAVSACAAIGAGGIFGFPDFASASPSSSSSSSGVSGCVKFVGESDTFEGGEGAVEIEEGVFFNKGEVLTFRLDTLVKGYSGTGTLALSLSGAGSASVSVEVTSVGSEIVTLTVPTTGTYTLTGDPSSGGPGNEFRLTFLGCNFGAAEEGIADQAARASFTQQSGLVFSRTSSLLLNKPQNRANPDAQTSFVPQAGMMGGAGQGADAFGVWADFTWSGLENDDAVSGSDGDSFTLSGGYDTPLGEGLIGGAAVSVGGAMFDRNASDDSTREINVGFTPYLAYQIDDIFAVQAAAGWTHVRGTAELVGVEGDYVTNRYFVAGEASAFQSWGDVSLFSSVGVLWGQSFQQKYTDDAGLRFGSVRTNLGSVSVTAQPSYLFTIDANEGDFIEPYILGQYSYDFSRTKVAGAANDADEFLLGAGVNGFTGDGLSGGVEFNRTLGREDNTATSVRATIRFDF